MDPEEPRPTALILCLLGAATGLLSGTFGIGGGVVLVPLMVGVLGFQHRIAAGTSVAAILPAGVVGGLSYAAQGNVDWVAAMALILGIVFGAQVGSFLLSRSPTKFLRQLFMAFILGAAISLWFIIPVRSLNIDMNFFNFSLLIVTGAITGVLSGLLGVGGGVIVVPILLFFFGSSDLVAKGTSLVMLVPGSISGTLGNLKRRVINVRAAVFLGISATVLSPVGAAIAANISPFWANVSFSLLLVCIFIQMLLKSLQARPKGIS